MKRKFQWISFLSMLLAVSLAVGGACPPVKAESNYTKFSRRDNSVFDTEITLIGFAPSEKKFEQVYEQTMTLLKEYDRIFDAYHGYDGLHNLYYVNRHAAQEPVEIPDQLFRLIAWCKRQWDSGLRSTNIAMGAVLSIWHEYREAGISDPASAALPPMEELERASAHISFDDVALDAEKQTVFFTDPQLSLDIGAVAKGWAADEVLPYLSQAMPSFLLSLGGNVYAGQPPMDGRSAWAVGVQDPQMDALALASGGTDILDIVDVSGLTVVTSGDYWRYYVVDGQRYHHIIDPETLFPSRKMLSVTVICASSALADFLSTTLFVLSYEDGLDLIQRLDGVEALWVLPDGTIESSPGMGQYSRAIRAGGAQ